MVALPLDETVAVALNDMLAPPLDDDAITETEREFVAALGVPMIVADGVAVIDAARDIVALNEAGVELALGDGGVQALRMMAPFAPGMPAAPPPVYVTAPAVVRPPLM